VLEGAQRAVLTQHAADFGEGAGWIVDAAEDEPAHDGVEAGGAER
jgi:hypothetical protein